MKNDLSDLKKVTADLMNGNQPISKESQTIAQSVYEELEENPSFMINAPIAEPKNPS